jgi:toxin ParE1/3/4
MAEYILSERAQNDLRRIWHYTVDTWSIEQAKRYYNEILDTCEAIANGQSRPGSSFEGIRLGVHGFRMKHHVIFYRILQMERYALYGFFTTEWTFPDIFSDKNAPETSGISSG